MLGDNRNGMLHASSPNNDNDIMCMTDIIFLNYLDEGITHCGMLTVEFEYSSNRCRINYLDVQFSDPELRKHVEGNPHVLRNIDSYLRNKLLNQEYNFNQL